MNPCNQEYMNSLKEYEILDHPYVTQVVFHPRPDWKKYPERPNVKNFQIPVEPNISIGGRFFIKDKTCPNILFFHGNGEIVSDYDDLGELYHRIDINFLPVDYRGYGNSTGTPSVSSMLKDAHAIFNFVKHWLEQHQHTGPLVVMGRSLGSASALELAYHYPHQLNGLIIESGFAFAGPLLELLGVDLKSIGFSEKIGFRNLEKIKSFDKPVLIIHAEFDHIIPFSDAIALFEACKSQQKQLIEISNADHNNIFYVGLSTYMSAIQSFMRQIQ